jgi:hypothetical protein
MSGDEEISFNDSRRSLKSVPPLSRATDYTMGVWSGSRTRASEGD